MTNNQLNKLQQILNDAESEEITYTSELIQGDVDVLQITVEDREEFPIYITVDECQILCVTHLWHEKEIKDGARETLLDALLTMNIPMPLSAFSKVGDQYILFGALAPSSSKEDIVHEIEVLSDNTLDAIEAVAEYLN